MKNNLILTAVLIATTHSTFAFARLTCVLGGNGEKDLKARGSLDRGAIWGTSFICFGLNEPKDPLRFGQAIKAKSRGRTFYFSTGFLAQNDQFPTLGGNVLVGGKGFSAQVKFCDTSGFWHEKRNLDNSLNISVNFPIPQKQHPFKISLLNMKNSYSGTYLRQALEPGKFQDINFSIFRPAETMLKKALYELEDVVPEVCKF